MTFDERSVNGAVDVRCFPSEDAGFTDLVQSILEETLAEHAGNGDHAPHDGRLLSIVERRVRDAYPLATIRRRDGLAEFGISNDELWYAFRDGSLGAGESPTGNCSD